MTPEEELIAAITRDQQTQNEVERLFHLSNKVMKKVQPILEDNIPTNEKIKRLNALAAAHEFSDIKTLHLFRLEVLSQLHKGNQYLL